MPMCSPPVPITLLNDTTDLLTRLHLSSISIVLLTAFWSVESLHVKSTLQTAANLVQCRHRLAYYHLALPAPSVPPLTAPPRMPFRPPFWPSSISAHVSQGHYFAAAHLNVTKNLPWLPAVQIYVNSSPAVDPVYHVDSFDHATLASHIEQQCRLFSNESRSSPDSRTGGGGGDDDEDADADADGDGVARSVIQRLVRLVTPVSRDRFARFMTESQHKHLFGAMLFVRGGVTSLRTAAGSPWHNVARALHTINTDDEPRRRRRRPTHWVVTVVDSQTDSELARRHAIDTRHGVVSLVLVDPVSQARAAVVVSPRLTAAALVAKLRHFSMSPPRPAPFSSPGHQHRPPSPQDPLRLALSYFTDPTTRPQFFQRPQTTLSLRNVLTAEYSYAGSQESVFWLVVHQPWCAFSQRIMPIYRRFAVLAESSRSDVHVLQTDQLSALPPFLDELVDGFPTILVLRRFGREVSVSEYLGFHTLHSLLDSHSVDLTTRLRQALTSAP